MTRQFNPSATAEARRILPFDKTFSTIFLKVKDMISSAGNTPNHPKQAKHAGCLLATKDQLLHDEERATNLL